MDLETIFKLRLVRMVLTFGKDTLREFSEFDSKYSKQDVNKEALKIKEHLRDEAYGLLINFDLEAKDGLNNFIIKEVSGDFVGTMKMRVILEASINVEDGTIVKKIARLLDKFEVYKIACVYVLDPPVPNLDNNLLVKVLKPNYTILKANVEKGVRVLLDEDFFAWIQYENNELKIELRTKYHWQFHKSMQKFSVDKFNESLVSSITQRLNS